MNIIKGLLFWPHNCMSPLYNFSFCPLLFPFMEKFLCCYLRGQLLDIWLKACVFSITTTCSYT